MGKRREYNPEQKAAVMAALMAGQSVSSVAQEYKIPRGTVASWRRNADAAYEVDQTQKGEIGDLLLKYLQASLVSLEAQVKLFGDREWLSKQDASELAVLHGVQTDKAIRLMEAFGRSDDSDSDTAH